MDSAIGLYSNMNATLRVDIVFIPFICRSTGWKQFVLFATRHCRRYNRQHPAVP